MQFAPLQLEHIYITTSTIIKWQHLLKHDHFKQTIIDSLAYLVKNDCIHLYAFVIMPNHIHLIWTMKRLNNKEMPNVSFMKFTGHRFLSELKVYHPLVLPYFQVDSSTRNHHFWQRNSLSIVLYSNEVLLQKLNYIHNNPISTKWMLADMPKNYKWSSAQFYNNGVDEFGILKHRNE